MLLPLLLLSSAFVSDAPKVPDPSESRTGMLPSPPPEPIQEEAWNDSMMAYISMMCLIMNCSLTRSNDGAAGAVQVWVETYSAGGLREDLTPTQRLWAKSQVIQLQLLAASDPGVLPTELKLAFTNSLVNILSELDP